MALGWPTPICQIWATKDHPSGSLSCSMWAGRMCLGYNDFVNWAVRRQAKVKAEPLLQRLARWRLNDTFQVRMKLQTVYLCSSIYLETWYSSGPLCDQVIARRSQMPVMAETQGPAGGHQKLGRSTAELDRRYCRVTKENSLRNLWTLPTQWREGWKNSGKTYSSHWCSSLRFLVVARGSVVPVMAKTHCWSPEIREKCCWPRQGLCQAIRRTVWGTCEPCQHTRGRVGRLWEDLIQVIQASNTFIHASQMVDMSPLCRVCVCIKKGSVEFSLIIWWRGWIWLRLGWKVDRPSAIISLGMWAGWTCLV